MKCGWRSTQSENISWAGITVYDTMQVVFENYQSGKHMVFKNKNVGSAILLGIISVFFLFNVSLCHAKNQPINAYEQVQARFGDSLNEGIKQLIGSEYNKQDINITPLSGGRRVDQRNFPASLSQNGA